MCDVGVLLLNTYKQTEFVFFGVRVTTKDGDGYFVLDGGSVVKAFVHRIGKSLRP